VTRDAARIGEHTEEVLREFGFTDELIAERLASGAVVAAGDPNP
jgi:hypothetical protein